MYSKTIIIGRLGRDPEMRYTPAGKAVTSFSVAVDEGFGENKVTAWYRVTAWEKLAESCNNFLQKGKLVLVEGHITVDEKTGSPRVYEKDGVSHSSLELTANAVKFLSGKEDQK
jgi:single-strand DNA-binding protein